MQYTLSNIAREFESVKANSVTNQHKSSRENAMMMNNVFEAKQEIWGVKAQVDALERGVMQNMRDFTRRLELLNRRMSALESATARRLRQYE